MAPQRRSSERERQPYRSSAQRDHGSDLPSRYELPQQSYPSRQSSDRRRSPPPRRDYPRRDSYRALPRRSEPLPRRLPARDSSYTSRRPVESNPFQRRYNERRLPERKYPSSSRRPARNDRQVWLPPVRNPARYISGSSVEKTSPHDSADNGRYPVRELTPIPEARRRERSRSPIDRRSSERNGSSSRNNDLPRRDDPSSRNNSRMAGLGPRTPSPENSEHDGSLEEEEHEIMDIVRNLFRECYQEHEKQTQINRFNWLREEILNIQNKIEDLRQQPQIDDLELVDSTDRPSNPIERDLNGEELDYQEEPDPSSRHNEDDVIKSPPADEFNHHIKREGE